MRTHQAIDARSLAYHRRVAERIRARPELMARVRETLTRFRHVAAPGAQPYLREWELLVEAGTEACLAMATEESERANALRQASPFAGLLAPREREALWREWAARHAT